MKPGGTDYGSLRVTIVWKPFESGKYYHASLMRGMFHSFPDCDSDSDCRLPKAENTYEDSGCSSIRHFGKWFRVVSVGRW